MESKNTLVLTSASFKNNEPLPLEHAHNGFASGAKNRSPELAWYGAPEKTKSFVLICHDPDAVGRTFIHWLLYNIPASITRLTEGLPTQQSLSVGLQGINDAHEIGYYGSRPPVGTGAHRYTFTLYALDELLPLNAGAKVDELKLAMRGHILAKAEIIGLVIAPQLQ